MKLPMRPNARPGGTSGAMGSHQLQPAQLSYGRHAIATSTPRKPPWNDMPPCHTAKISSGWLR
jgi:hypothetical protein